ncbi:translocation/assembly module TamB domain-containing protein [Parapedobacter sp. DT-150]|uniref:translocation/assembly module TamB domain-containing protein n=1 Tax=Parapedobacter sp. DT-150 TaxID=3396162 RepID=UPI003F1DCF45
MLLLAGLVYSLQYRPVQTYFAKKAAAYLSSELNTTVSLDGLYFRPFSSLVLQGLFVADQTGDTLLYADQLAAAVDLWKLRDSRVIVKQAKLTGGRFFVKRDTAGSNLSFIVDYFRPMIARQSGRRRITLDVRSVTLSDVTIGYQQLASRSTGNGIRFGDIQLTELSGSFTDIDVTNHLFKAAVNGLTFREKSGFMLREMNALAVVDSSSLELRDLYLATNRSRLRDHLRLEYADFSAFDHFVDAVGIQLDLDRAYIHSRDIEYFAPAVAATRFAVTVSGSFSGKASSITARRVALSMGNHTGLQGNFTITGLPDINQTLFDIQLTRLTTNSLALESLVPQLGHSAELKLPPFIHRLGDLTYQGTLKGLYHDFVAKGTLETALGSVDTDINLMLRDGGQYAGQLSAADFDLGILLQQAQFGHGSFDLTVDGRGFAINDIDSKVAGDLHFLDFRGYRYRNIDLLGTFVDRQFTGDIGVNDPNLQLQFAGGINFNPEWPEYAFSAEVAHAHLPNLGFYPKAQVVIGGATLVSNFKGNTLNNIHGDIALRDVHFRTNNEAHTIDSLALVASGGEQQRTLRLHSDMADATLNGEIDLNTLGNYFKSVAMRYAPSMGLTLGTVGKQAFHFNLELKDALPITALLAPDLHVPEGASVNADFSTATGVANFNLLVPHVSRGNLHVRRLIIDESTQEGALRLFVTADRISLGDSLYVNNVNLSNVIVGDSLQFNLKAADASASNRLDLNGLVHFEKDAPLNMQLLSSSLVLNNEPWQFDRDARFYLRDGKLTVRGFQLSNNHQIVRLDGVISADAEDNASLTFNNFNLHTLNAITLPSGMNLGGVLDGQMDVSSVLKNPFALTDMVAKDVRINQTTIGDVLLQANFDRVSELVNVRLEAIHDGVNTLMATGTYNAAAQTDKLNVKANLNHTELLVFQPLLGRLVSDIAGTVSADLHITGSILAPKINGTCHLHDAQFTVNYLKTPYRIDDEVSLSNSTIILEELVVVDPGGHNAVANGKIDMSNPLIPVIDVVVDATDFLVLNTTFRHNPLYYGIAYGTGRFAFHGPTNAMNIAIQAQTGENTSIHIPLNAVGTVSDNDFIHFVRHDTLEAQRPQSRLFKGLSMDMDLQITPDAETSLYTDLGELSGRGEGSVSLHISSLGDFEMFGDYTINIGKFTFTAQDFINKIFDINQGGTIRWTGQPTDATINLTAVYGQRTSLSPLYNAAGRETVEQRVMAQALMNLNGNVMRPDITFALNFPNDPYVKDELQSYLSDVNNVNQQALSLIVRRSFVPGGAADLSRELNNTLLSAGTELAFNQLNNLIAQSLNLNFVDLNIRSLNDASASVRLFNDRLIFTGGVTDRRNLTDLSVFSDRVVTDAELLYLIRKDGRLVLRGSNRLNSRNFLPLTMNDNYVSALGLVYRQEFYTFQEYFQRLFRLRRKEAEEEPVKTP